MAFKWAKDVLKKKKKKKKSAASLAAVQTNEEITWQLEAVDLQSASKRYD